MNKTLQIMTINTPIHDFMLFIRNNGIETQDLETINKIADIIGNCPINELVAEAKKDMNTFFFMLKYVWSQIDIINFYNDHFSQKVINAKEENDSIIAENETMTRMIEMYKNTISTNDSIIARMTDKASWFADELKKYQKSEGEYLDTMNDLYKTIESQNNDILQLKAKMFDMMNK